MSNFLPSRRYGLFLVVTILVVAGVLWYGQRVTPIVTADRRLPSGETTAEGSLLAVTASTSTSQKTLPTLPTPSVSGIAEPKLEERILGEADARTGLTLKDLKIIGSESSERVRQYGLELRDALSAFAGADTKDPLALFVAAFEKGKLENVPVLLQLSDKHDNAVLNLGALSVPGSAAPQQLRVMRSIAHRGQLLRVMATLQSAPVDALAAADQYVLESNMLIEHLSEMNRYFAERGITFSKSEQGKFAYTRYE